MAIIYTRCGEYDKALDELEELLTQQTSFSVNDFNLHRELVPLRKLPRYRQMVQKYSRLAQPL